MEDLRYLIDQGKIYFKNQAFKKAEAVFLRILANKNEFADVYNMLGMIAHQTGQFGRAIDYLQKALKINPNYTEALINLSVLYNDLGEYKLSRQLTARMKKLEGKGPRVPPYLKGKLANRHADVGDLYRGVGLYVEAIGEYQKALVLSPHFSDIRYKMALCLREEGKKKEALDEFLRIIKEKPHYADAQIQAGITLYALGKKKEAQKVWNRLTHVNPRHQLVKIYLRLSGDQKKSAKGK